MGGAIARRASPAMMSPRARAPCSAARAPLTAAARCACAPVREQVAARPFLFEQASVDVAVERAKQEAHDKFDAALRKSGLANMLDPS